MTGRESFRNISHLAFLIYVGMIDLCFESNLGRLEWVLGWKVDFNPESTLVVRGIFLDIFKARLAEA